MSKFGYGAHMTQELVPFVKERQVMIREAYDHGITLFDIYDHGAYHQFRPMSKSLAGKRHRVAISLVAVEEDVRAEVEGAIRVFNRDESTAMLVSQDGTNYFSVSPLGELDEAWQINTLWWKSASGSITADLEWAEAQ